MTHRLLLWAAITGLNSSAPRPEAPRPSFDLPVICAMNSDCLVQKLVDVDTGPERRDYRCGTLTTDGHDGIDIRLRTFADMRKGFSVIAAASGRVLRMRDGEPDLNVRDRGNLNGRDAGNAVVIDHGNGWETQYSHLRKGSVLVHPDATIKAGDRIGLIGMSGNAEFPHLHFTVRHNGRAIDPFTGRSSPTPCGAESDQRTLWRPSASRALPYRPTAIITVGFASAAPSSSGAERERNDQPQSASLLILWADVLGALPGDTQRFEIRGTDGQLIFEQTSTVQRGGLSWLAYAGRKPPAGGWPRGLVTGRYELKRSGKIVDTREARLIIG